MVLGGKHLMRTAVYALERLAALEVGYVLYVDLAFFRPRQLSKFL